MRLIGHVVPHASGIFFLRKNLLPVLKQFYRDNWKSLNINVVSDYWEDTSGLLKITMRAIIGFFILVKSIYGLYLYLPEIRGDDLLLPIFKKALL